MKTLNKYFVLFVILLTASVSFGNENEEEQKMKNYNDFENQIIELSKQISQTTKYAYQDVEFVENEMDGDETVYERAWKGDGYFLIRNYKNDEWSEDESYLTSFTFTENSSFNLGGKIKIGSSVEELKNFFGDFLQDNEVGSNEYYLVGDGCWFSFYIDSAKQCLNGVSYSVRGGYMTSKMLLLNSLYDNQFTTVKIKGEKVNVRDEPKNGNILFQVSRSKNDKLIVRKNDDDGWYSIVFKLTDNDAGIIDRQAYIRGDFLEKEADVFSESEKEKLASIFMNSRVAKLEEPADVKAPIEDVRERMYYQNYPQDLDYLPFGKQLEKFFAKGQWSEERVPALEEYFSKLAVFKGIGTWDGRRTWVTVKIGRAKKKIRNNINEGSLVVISILENKNLLYSYDMVMPSGITGAYFNLLTAELEAYSGKSVRNKISLSDFIDTIYKESEIEQLFKSF